MALPFEALWRVDLDALQFVFCPPDRLCMVHRLAFRALLGAVPTPDTCLEYFLGHSEAFQAAALAKAARSGATLGNIHINSRDVARMLNAPRLP